MRQIVDGEGRLITVGGPSLGVTPDDARIEHQRVDRRLPHQVSHLRGEGAHRGQGHQIEQESRFGLSRAEQDLGTRGTQRIGAESTEA
ncbi:hypothetical protein MWU75_08460 [Ornithinimicrobium sp. F0845]|uniref:hypothetical protein n=1 Tax=Ornithinimicrobium sp. F0845 TaxID=2926412 RepID=UPI001FF4BD1C|nr:hypothetical protein [Ornithinimicrobium sp. F0845]MCK0112166.1 hypothetical protein [Ornithinimicrobium sp. F0845]